MKPIVKQHFSSILVEELAHLSGEQFEHLCKYVMELETDENVVLDGHNLYNKPVGYTEDLHAPNAVGQCGTEENYFNGANKAYEDTQKCIGYSAQCKHVYLFSNRLATGGQRPQLEKDLKIKYRRYTIHVYDAKKIAESVCDHIEYTMQIEGILAYLPFSKKCYDLFPLSNALPPLSNTYFHREKEEQKVLEMLQEQSIIQVYGLSGIGKTQLTLALATQLQQSYHVVVWASNFQYDENSMTDVVISRMGEHINLETMLTQMKVLFIADNMLENVRAFANDFKRCNKQGSCLIITSQVLDLPKEESYELPSASKEESRQILRKYMSEPFEEEDRFLDAVNGYPLMIELASSLVKEGDITLGDLLEGVDLTRIEDKDRHEMFAERILMACSDRYLDILSFIGTLNVNLIAEDFLKKSFDSNKLRAMKDRSIVKKEGNMLRIHDLVLRSIRSTKELVSEVDIEKTVSSYVTPYVRQNSDIYFYVFVYLHEQLLRRIIEKSEDKNLVKSIIYCIMRVHDNHKEVEQFLRMIDEVGIDVTQSLVDVYLFCEKCEMIADSLRNDDRKDKYCQFIDEANKLLPTLEAESQLTLKHHIGKWYKIVGDKESAKRYFEEILKTSPKEYRTKFQLAKLYMDDGNFSDAKLLVNDLMAPENRSTMPMSILLSTYELLNRDGLEEEKKIYLDGGVADLQQLMVALLYCDTPLVYKTIAGLSGYLAHRHSDVIVFLCQILKERGFMVNDASMAYQLCQIYIGHIRYSECLSETDRNELIAECEKLVTITPPTSDYERKLAIDIYCQKGDINACEEIYKNVEDADDAFACQSMAKAYITSAQYNDALTLIEKSIASTRVKKEGQRASFYHDKALALDGLGRVDCIACMNKALLKHSDEKTKRIWTAELETMRRKYNTIDEN